MWVPQFGGHVESEVLGILNGAVPQLDTDGTSLLERLFLQQGLQDWVQFLTNVLHQNWGSKLDAVFEGADKVRVSELDNVEVVGFLHVLDPLVGLALGVDHQWPPTGIAGGREGGRGGRWEG